MSFELLKAEVAAGIEGKNNGIPLAHKRLSRYIGIRRRIMTLIFGPTGSGKSAYLHDTYILNPFDWYYKNKPKDLKFKVILFSMERSKVYIMAKWLSRKIFIDQGIHIPIQKLLGWWDKKLNKDEHDLFLAYEWYINELLEIVDIIEGPQNPTGIWKYVNDYAKANGTFHKLSDYETIYEPNNPNEIVIVGEDHLGLTKKEKGLNTKKDAIDKVSEHNQYFRDKLGYIPIPVSQLTRNLNNPMFQKMDSFEPTIDDIKESGRPGEDSDVVISIFEPMRYRTEDSSYNAGKFVDRATGAKHFRSVKILKNSFGEDDVKIGMGMMGACGIFKELPKPTEMENFDYDSLFNGQYYL